MSIVIYYDGQCPFCQAYVSYLRLEAAIGKPVLIDVREATSTYRMLSHKGYDLDRGMLVDVDGRYYFGADAMTILASLSTRSGVFNKASYWLMSNRHLAAILYPLFRLFRNLILLVLHRPSLNTKEPQSLLTLFCLCWGLFSYLHLLVYAYHFGAPVYTTTIALGVLGVLLFLKPESRLLLLLIFIFGAIDAWRHMPIFSNHTNIKNFFLLAVVMGGIGAALGGKSWNEFFAWVAPIGRALLLIMYIFGVFHKINSGFLNPAVSCAGVLWQQMPWPLSLLDMLWLNYVFIYGTLVIESIIFICLLVPALRYWGILVGIAFHMFLALSNYSMYAPFSMLSLTLHVLFLSPAAAARIVDDLCVKKILTLSKSPKGLLLVAGYCFLLWVLAWLYRYAGVAIVWFIIVIPFLYLVFKHGRDTGDRVVWGVFLSSKKWLNLVSIAFFISCVSPYLGLKTAQSVNMFANLRLEGGVSNHLLLSRPPGPFGYLDDIVFIRDSAGVGYFSYIKNHELHLVYYDMLSRLSDSPGGWVSYERNGVFYERQTVADLAKDMDAILHPKWVRKWFHFTPVDTTLPKPCALDR